MLKNKFTNAPEKFPNHFGSNEYHVLSQKFSCFVVKILKPDHRRITNSLNLIKISNESTLVLVLFKLSRICENIEDSTSILSEPVPYYLNVKHVQTSTSTLKQIFLYIYLREVKMSVLSYWWKFIHVARAHITILRNVFQYSEVHVICFVYYLKH